MGIRVYDRILYGELNNNENFHRRTKKAVSDYATKTISINTKIREEFVKFVRETLPDRSIAKCTEEAIKDFMQKYKKLKPMTEPDRLQKINTLLWEVVAISNSLMLKYKQKEVDKVEIDKLLNKRESIQEQILELENDTGESEA